MEIRADNPGASVRGNVAFSNGERNWCEEFDLVESLASVLEENGFTVERNESHIELPQFSLSLAPRLVDGVEPLAAGGVHTVSTLEFRHPDYFPDGLFEYQHAVGDSVMAAFTDGFRQWVNADLFAIADVVDRDEQRCTHMRLSLPAREGRPELERVVVLGPLKWAGSNQIQDERSDGHSPQCPCCLLTNTWRAFKDILEGSDTFGIKLVGLRDQEGQPGADCRVNGLDFPGGEAALREYVTKWDGEGFEMRKQYVLVRTGP